MGFACNLKLFLLGGVKTEHGRLKMSMIHVRLVCLIIAVIPLHDFIILLDLLFDVGKFALQVLAALLLLQESWVLEVGCDPFEFSIILMTKVRLTIN